MRSILLVSACVAVCISVSVTIWRELNDERAQLEMARTEGYAAAVADVLIVIATGGGVDEILTFVKAKSDSGFHDGFGHGFDSLTNIPPQEIANGQQ